MNSYSYDYDASSVYQWDYAYDRWNSTDDAPPDDSSSDSEGESSGFDTDNMSFYDSYYGTYFNGSVVAEQWDSMKKGSLYVHVAVGVTVMAAISTYL